MKYLLQIRSEIKGNIRTNIIEAKKTRQNESFRKYYYFPYNFYYSPFYVIHISLFFFKAISNKNLKLFIPEILKFVQAT